MRQRKRVGRMFSPERLGGYLVLASYLRLGHMAMVMATDIPIGAFGIWLRCADSPSEGLLPGCKLLLVIYSIQNGLPSTPMQQVASGQS